MRAQKFKKKRPTKKPGWVLVLQVLRDKMPPDKAWRTEKIARVLGKTLPATRRYLRILVSARLLLEADRGRFKYYALPKASAFRLTVSPEKMHLKKETDQQLV